MDAYATINNMQEISWKTGYLLSNIYMGIQGFAGMGYCVDDMQMMPPVKLQLMTSQGSCTKQITHINCTNELHKTITQGKMTSCPRMEMMNDAFGFSRATQVHMEDLRLVNLSEYHPSQRVE